MISSFLLFPFWAFLLRCQQKAAGPSLGPGRVSQLLAQLPCYPPRPPPPPRLLESDQLSYQKSDYTTGDTGPEMSQQVS